MEPSQNILWMWMDAILLHLRNPGMMITPINTNNPTGSFLVQDFVHPQYDLPASPVGQVRKGREKMCFFEAAPDV